MNKYIIFGIYMSYTLKKESNQLVNRLKIKIISINQLIQEFNVRFNKFDFVFFEL